MIRQLHRFYACVNGYFWLPCPVCKKMFGGHESDITYTPLVIGPDNDQHAMGVCSKDCSAKAKEMNRANRRDWQSWSRYDTQDHQ